MKTKFLLFVCLIVALDAESVRGQTFKNSSLNPLSNITENFGKSFSGTNLIWHSAALSATVLIVTTDVDFTVHSFLARHSPAVEPYTTVALWGGYLAPLVVSGGMLASGYVQRDESLFSAGCAALQAVTISSVVVAGLKAVTGRPGPDTSIYHDMRAASHLFRFGFLRGGIHYGWPSGHLAVNSALITSLMSYYEGSATAKWVGFAAIAYLIFGVSAHEGATMHWFSDVIAGTIIGSVIGTTVGTQFHHQQQKDDSARAASVTLSPKISPTITGICITISL